MSITIRPAIREDCPRLLELIRELAVYEKAPDEVTVTPGHFAASGFGPSPVWWAFVAAEPASGDQPEFIAGFALYYIRYSTWKGQRMYLEDIIVTESMRGKGIGHLLFEALITEAKEKKLAGISWQVLDWNEPAIRFYKKYQARFEGEWVNCSIGIDTGS